MRRFFVAGILLAFVGCSGGSGFAAQASSTVDDLAAGRYNLVESRFDATMKEGLPADKLAVSWIGFLQAVGGYRGHGKPRETKSGEYTVELVPVRAGRGAAGVEISFDAAGRIAGLHYK